MANLGLTEMITNKYGGQGPGITRSHKKGQEIDGIWASQGIIISQGGYLPFHDVPKSDHRLLWIKISHEITFGENKAPYRAPSARRLRLDHIRDQKKYTSNLRLLTRENNLPQRLGDLAHLQTFPPSQKSIEEYENIDQLLTKARLQADSKTRKLHMKKVQSSRKVKLAQLRVRLCDMLIKINGTDTKIKLKTVSNLAKITGRRWWLHLEHTTLLHTKKKKRMRILLPQEKQHQYQRDIPRRKSQRRRQRRKHIER